MAEKRKEPTQTTEKGLEIPIPTREDWDATLSKLIKPVRGSHEIVDAENVPADGTDDG